jgi:hypothetical protein
MIPHLDEEVYIKYRLMFFMVRILKDHKRIKMRKWLSPLLLLAFIFPHELEAATKNQIKSREHAPFGLGVVLGAPTAITGKYWTNRDNAIDFGISFGSSYNILVYGDYLWHYPGYFGHSSKFISELNAYLGLGAGLFSWGSGYYGDRPYGWRTYSGDTGFYVRVPLGAEWYAHRPPIGVFAELAPGLSVIPGIGVTIDAGIGARYYF